MNINRVTATIFNGFMFEYNGYINFLGEHKTLNTITPSTSVLPL